MKIKFCDACGNEVKDFYGVLLVNQRTCSYTSASVPQPKTLDLCEKCSHELQKTMKETPYELHIDSDSSEQTIIEEEE